MGRKSAKPTLHPVFADCCDPHYLRFDISTPFSCEYHVYATDGCIIVRIAWDQLPDGFEITNGPRRLPKDPWRAFVGPHSDPIPLPGAIGLPTIKRCDFDAYADAVCVAPGFLIHPFYACLLARHGIEELRLPTDTSAGENATAFRFDLGPIDGRLMPMTKVD